MKKSIILLLLVVVLAVVTGKFIAEKGWVERFITKEGDTTSFVAAPSRQSVDNVTGRYLGFLYTNQNNFFTKSAALAKSLIGNIDHIRFQESGFLTFLEAGQYEEALLLADILKNRKSIFASLSNILLSLDALKSGATEQAKKPARDINGFSDIANISAELFALWITPPDNNDAIIEKAKQLNSATYSISASYALIHLGSPQIALSLLEDQTNDRLTQQRLEAEIYSLLALGDFETARIRLESHFSLIPSARPIFDPLYQIALSENATVAPKEILFHLSNGLSALAEEFAGNNGQLSLVLSQLALYADPVNDSARLFLAHTQEAFGQYKEGIDTLSRINKKSPFFQEALFEKARLHISDKNEEEALKILKSVEKLDTAQYRSFSGQGRIYSSLDDFDAAQKAYSQAISIIDTPNSADWQIFYERGISYSNSDRWPEAEKDFLKALELSPDQPLILNYLAYSWLERGENLEKARAMLEVAVKQRRNSGFIIDSLGWAYYKLEDYPNAILWLEQAIILMPQDSVVNDHLGDAYWKSGRFNEARFQWQKALDLKPEEKEHVKLIEEKLTSGLKKEALLSQ